MARKISVGDWVFITGSNRIRQDFFDKHFPMGHFGKVFKIDRFFSRFDGRRLPAVYWVRCYTKNGRIQLKSYSRFIKEYSPKVETFINTH